jgi:predicted AlkP superfamily pyrophosphatase or phosphodiesterase
VEKALGDDKIHTAIISGKSVNMDSDAPRRVPYEWWSRHSDTNGLLELFSPKKRIERIGARIVEEDGKKYVSIPGKVYHLTRKGIDSFVNGLGNNHKTAEYAMDAMVRQKNNPFFMAVIFAEPDNSGHKYGEGSRGYKNGIRACDDWTGAILGKLKELGIYDRTLIYVVSDHGFDAGRRTHNKAPRVFLATNDRQVNRNGDRADIAPTILKRFGIHPARIVPALTGTALDEPLPHQNR